MQLNFGNLFDPTTAQIYVVGGTVRDILLGREPLDIDVAVYPDPNAYARRLADKCSGRLVVLGRPDQMLYRVVTPQKIYDISKLRGKSIRIDLSRRDFTINAIAYDVLEKKIIDVTGGRRDLTHRIVRMVSHTSLQDDPIRLIRAYRLAAELMFKIEPATLEAIAHNAKQILRTAGERVRDELFKILSTPSSHDQLVNMAANDLLIYLFPELLPLKKLRQDSRTGHTVFDHSMDAYSILEKNLHTPPLPDIVAGSDPESPKGAPRAILPKLSILLHNIGKAEKATSCINNRFKYTGHAQRGATLFESIAERLHLSNRDRIYIGSMIRNHRRPWFLFKAHQKRGSGNRLHMVRFILNLLPYVPDLFLHALADEQSKTSNECRAYTDFQQFVDQLLIFYHQHILPRIDDGPIINGNDLINRFGLSPSPQFKSILRRVEELRLIGQLKSAADAQNWVQTLLNSKQASTASTHRSSLD